jgi:hypothetical protein
MSSSPLSPQSGQKQTAPVESNPMQRLFRTVFQINSPSMSSVFGSSTSNHPHDDDLSGYTHAGAHISYSNSRTRSPFKPQKAGRGTSNWQLKEFAEATLGSGSLKKAVKLPEGEDENEWLAVNGIIHQKSSSSWISCLRSAVVDFYNQINLLYGAITEFCSPQSCPEMKATDEYISYGRLLEL